MQETNEKHFKPMQLWDWSVFLSGFIFEKLSFFIPILDLWPHTFYSVCHFS